MNEYLTYAALETDDLDFVLHQCGDAAKRLGLRFEVPSVPTDAAHIWVGLFNNGWIFSLADPAVWELLDVFSRVAKTYALPYLCGSTEGDYHKWSYEYSEGGQLLHRFYSDPSSRLEPAEYSKAQGDPYAMEEIFGVSLFQLRKLFRQSETGPVQEFLSALGFEIQYARTLRFVVIEQTVGAESSDISTVLSPEQVAGIVGKTGMFQGLTTQAIDVIKQADDAGYSHAASLKTSRFIEKQDYNEAQKMFIRLRREGRHELALTAADLLVQRAKSGEFDRLPEIQRDLRVATVHGLRGMALADLGRYDEAIVELKGHALSFNRYIGPQHRPTMAGLLGKALMSQHRYTEAIDPLLLRLAERFTDAKTWADLANAAMHSDQEKLAKWAAVWGIASDSSLPDWQPIRIHIGVREHDLFPPRQSDLAKVRRHEGRALVKAGRKTEAIEKYREALHHAPKDIDSAWALASVLAESLREGLIELDMNDFELLRLLEQVAFTSPSWPWSWGYLIELLLRRQQTDRARQACEAYSRVHVTKINEGVDLGVWITHIDPEMGVCALHTLTERFVELRLRGMSKGERESDRHRSFAMLGWAYLRANRYHEALTPLVEATKTDPNDVENWCNLAEVHYRMKNNLAASKAIQRGLKIQPDHPRLNELQRRVRN